MCGDIMEIGNFIIRDLAENHQTPINLHKSQNFSHIKHQRGIRLEEMPSQFP